MRVLRFFEIFWVCSVVVVVVVVAVVFTLNRSFYPTSVEPPTSFLMLHPTEKNHGVTINLLIGLSINSIIRDRFDC